MRLYSCLLFMVLAFASHAGEAPPAWLLEQLSDHAAIAKPGVYMLKDSRLLGVGQGKLHESLRDTRAQRTALDTAEHDAKRRIAKHLYPEVFEKYPNVAVEIRHAVRAFEQSPTPRNSFAHVGLVIDSNDVSVIPILDSSVVLDAKKVVVAPEMLVYLEDPLLQMGGGRIFSRDGGWVVVGVGVAPLFGNDSVAERDAMKRARLEAGKAIAETVFGSTFEVMEREAESQLEHDGIVNMRQWSSRMTRESVEGELKQAVEIGYWLTNDDHVAVVIAAANPALDPDIAFALPPDTEEAELPDFPDWNVDPHWEYVLLNRPLLLQGGAVLSPDETGVWIAGVGVGKLTGNAANDSINAPRAAEMDARRHIIRYVNGFSSRSNVEDIEEVVLILNENGLESSAILESLQKMTKEKTSGLVRNLIKAGSWKSMDRKLLYQIHIVRLSGSAG